MSSRSLEPGEIEHQLTFSNGDIARAVKSRQATLSFQAAALIAACQLRDVDRWPIVLDLGSTPATMPGMSERAALA